MSAIDVVRAWLANKPGIVVRATSDSVSVEPIDSAGFQVELLVRGPEHWTVYFAGWHEEFNSEAEALRCVAFGLSEECRLRVEKRGQLPVKWTVEVRENGSWLVDSKVGLFHPFFWRARSVEYLTNPIFPTRRPPAT